MIMVSLTLIAAQASATVVAPPGVPQGSGVVYGDDVGVAVRSPGGWVLDGKSGAPRGLDAVMYPTGSTWENATEIMYVDVARLDAGQSVTGFIDNDLAKYRHDSPEIRSKTGDPVQMSRGGRAELRLYEGDRRGNSEAVAYLARGSHVVLYVLSCRSREGFERGLPVFRRMVTESIPVAMKFEHE